MKVVAVRQQIHLWACAALLLLPSLGPTQDVAPDTARLAIDFKAVDLENQPFHGKSLAGKIILLDFWAVW